MSVQTFFPLIWDSTQLDVAKSCPIKFFRNHVQHFQSAENIDLVAGAALAKGIHVTRDCFYTHGMDVESSIAQGMEALIEEYGDFVDHYKPAKSVARMCLALESYFDQYDLRFDEITPLKLHDGSFSVEYGLLEPIRDENGEFILHPTIGKPLLFSGRLDMLAEYMGGIWMVDEKTTGSYFNKNWAEQWQTRGQFTAYKWLAQKSGISEIKNLAGTIVRGISLPTSSSKIEATQAKFYTDIASIGHIQTFVSRNDYEVACWERDMVKTIKQMLLNYHEYLCNDSKTPEKFFGGNFGSYCVNYNKLCQFTQTCKSENGERFLETEYEQHIWLPNIPGRMPLDKFLATLESTNKEDTLWKQ